MPPDPEKPVPENPAGRLAGDTPRACGFAPRISSSVSFGLPGLVHGRHQFLRLLDRLAVDLDEHAIRCRPWPPGYRANGRHPSSPGPSGSVGHLTLRWWHHRDTQPIIIRLGRHGRPAAGRGRNRHRAKRDRSAADDKRARFRRLRLLFPGPGARLGSTRAPRPSPSPSSLPHDHAPLFGGWADGPETPHVQRQLLA